MNTKSHIYMFLAGIFLLLTGCLPEQTPSAPPISQFSSPSLVVSVSPEFSPTPALSPTPSPANQQTQAAIIMATVSAIKSITAEVENLTATIIALTPTQTSTTGPTKVPTRRPTSTIRPISTRTSTPSHTLLPAQATITATGALCTNQTTAEISPDGMWVAATCRGQDGVLDSHLRVVSIQDTRDWTIKFGDYAEGITYDRNNMIVPFHWSIDGRYLYASSPSKASGCCWLGTEVLLVQLNLQTGEQIALLNVNEERYPAIYFTVSTNDRFLLYITPIDNDLVIQDLSTGQARKIELEFPDIVDVGFIVMSEDMNKLVLALLEPETGELDREIDSIALIDLQTGTQKKLIENMTPGEELYPVRWEDENHVLLSLYRINQLLGELWLLNIQTLKLTKIANP